MRHQMHSNAFRFTRYAMIAWSTFALTFLLSKFGATYFDLSTDFVAILGTSAQLSFAFGCLFSSGIGGLLTFARSTRF